MLLFACAQNQAERQISCLTMAMQVIACHFWLMPRKWGMVNARQHQRLTGTPLSRLEGSTLTCLSQSSHSCDNRSSLATGSEDLWKSLVPNYTPTQTACSPHLQQLLLPVCLQWSLTGLSSLSKLVMEIYRAYEEMVMVHKSPSQYCSLLACWELGWRLCLGAAKVKNWSLIPLSCSKTYGRKWVWASEETALSKSTKKLQVVTMVTLQVTRLQMCSITLPDGWERPVVKLPTRYFIQVIVKLDFTSHISIYIQLALVQQIYLACLITGTSLFLVGIFSQVISGEISTWRLYAVSRGGRMAG